MANHPNRNGQTKHRAEALISALCSTDTFPMDMAVTNKDWWDENEYELQLLSQQIGEVYRRRPAPAYAPDTELEAGRLCAELYRRGYVGVTGQPGQSRTLPWIRLHYKGEKRTIRGSAITSVDYNDDFVKHLAAEFRNDIDNKLIASSPSKMGAPTK